VGDTEGALSVSISFLVIAVWPFFCIALVRREDDTLISAFWNIFCAPCIVLNPRRHMTYLLRRF
jgi:hypothetical protein